MSVAPGKLTSVGIARRTMQQPELLALGDEEGVVQVAALSTPQQGNGAARAVHKLHGTFDVVLGHEEQHARLLDLIHDGSLHMRLTTRHRCAWVLDN